jgi:hypothetical protein
MAGTLTVDTIQSDSSYASTLNVASKINFTSGMQIGGQDTTFGGMRNRIINGDMRIDQRNVGASFTYNSVANAYSIDRWRGNASGGGIFTVQRSSVAPSGFANSIVCTVTTNDSSVGATDFYHIRQTIEGHNIADLGFGTNSATPITVSFWVRSSVTGTYALLVRNQDGNRGYTTTYTINSANTFEYKTITIAGDTTGTWYTNNNGGLILNFSLGTGFVNPNPNAWGSSVNEGLSSITQWISNSGATFYLTGVQLEKGSAASPFEQLQYGQQFALCQRYFESTYPPGYAPGYNFNEIYPFTTSNPLALNFIASDDTTTSQSIRFVVEKRTNATVIIYSANNGATANTFSYKATGGTALNVPASVIYSSSNLCNIGQVLSAVNQANESYFHLTASAEL